MRIVAAAACVLAIYACGLLYEGFLERGYSGFFTVPFPDKPSAERAYDRLPASAPVAQRRAAAARLIASDPSNPESWNVVAFANVAPSGKLTPAGILALEHSYTLSFFDRREAVWRVTFALGHWDELADQTREDALAEAKVSLADARLAPQLRSRLAAVNNPAGRLAALLMLGEMEPIEG